MKLLTAKLFIAQLSIVKLTIVKIELLVLRIGLECEHSQSALFGQKALQCRAIYMHALVQPVTAGHI